MAPTGKTSDARRKSAAKASLVVTLTLSPDRLRCIISPESVKDDKSSARSKDAERSPSDSSNSISATQPTTSHAENASDSNAPTPAADGTPAPSAMKPPAEGPKKKGTKRSAAVANGSEKPRLEDGTIDHSGPAGRSGGTHKLGPKANQGAINAGLRALDRSGKPCRKWCRGGFTLKSFTGVVWEVSRWRAPTKKVLEAVTDDSNAPSADNSSSKENKENGVEANSGSNSHSGGDVDMGSVNSINASSPAPMAVVAAS
ncbi:hypothetical protein GQ602_002047 [Ophiocordyceps camponoti-floridani]|uniref:Uncharacterized protein n=1 Tax=Ophiocordyceps camponoti-floridani TaxID=2030778 RepID=A0A8H4VF64_9HYPO|nr:hypothetical protein GQ602_002047 [Ophiocordyceps camponoti-floridani]